MMTEQDRARFWAQVDTSGDCWLWTGPVDSYGYGRISIDGKSVKVHRLAWEDAEGPIPVGQGILHTCDHRRCVRRVHLFTGTQADNMHDRAHKGRYYTADGRATCGTPKLTPEQVLEIRARYIPRKVGTYRLAKEYQVSQQTIYQIVIGEKWKGLDAA